MSNCHRLNKNGLCSKCKRAVPVVGRIFDMIDFRIEFIQILIFVVVSRYPHPHPNHIDKIHHRHRPHLHNHHLFRQSMSISFFVVILVQHLQQLSNERELIFGKMNSMHLVADRFIEQMMMMMMIHITLAVD